MCPSRIERLRFTFNLAKGIELSDSASVPGIQLADLTASIVLNVINKEVNEVPQLWTEFADASLSPDSLFPDLDCLDLSTTMALANFAVLADLADRARLARDPLSGMDEFYELVIQHASEFKRFI